MKVNRTKARELIETAQRAINIVTLILAGKTGKEIIEETGAKRQLVEYYQKVLIVK